MAAGTLACGAIPAGAANHVATASATGAGVAASGPPAPLTILKTSPDIGSGDIFIANSGPPGRYGQGPEILSTTGKVIWPARGTGAREA